MPTLPPLRVPPRSIICHQTKQQFKSVAEAAEQLGMPYQAIYGYVNGYRKSDVFGYTFEYEFPQDMTNKGRKFI